MMALMAMTMLMVATFFLSFSGFVWIHRVVGWERL
jgi:hypothetical protein